MKIICSSFYTWARSCRVLRARRRVEYDSSYTSNKTFHDNCYTVKKKEVDSLNQRKLVNSMTFQWKAKFSGKLSSQAKWQKQSKVKFIMKLKNNGLRKGFVFVDNNINESCPKSSKLHFNKKGGGGGSNGLLQLFFSSINRTKYSRMDQVKFVEDSLTWSILEYFVPNNACYRYLQHD